MKDTKNHSACISILSNEWLAAALAAVRAGGGRQPDPARRAGRDGGAADPYLPQSALSHRPTEHHTSAPRLPKPRVPSGVFSWVSGTLAARLWAMCRGLQASRLRQIALRARRSRGRGHRARHSSAPLCWVEFPDLECSPSSRQCDQPRARAHAERGPADPHRPPGRPARRLACMGLIARAARPGRAAAACAPLARTRSRLGGGSCHPRPCTLARRVSFPPSRRRQGVGCRWLTRPRRPLLAAAGSHTAPMAAPRRVAALAAAGVLLLVLGAE